MRRTPSSPHPPPPSRVTPPAPEHRAAPAPTVPVCEKVGWGGGAGEGEGGRGGRSLLQGGRPGGGAFPSHPGGGDRALETPLSATRVAQGRRLRWLGLRA